jgi:hypothetical protein
MVLNLNDHARRSPVKLRGDRIFAFMSNEDSYGYREDLKRRDLIS